LCNTIIEPHKTTKLNQILIAYYIEIIANSSYAPRNNGNYSQVQNMIMISGVWNTTHSKNITPPQNNDKLPSTNMHTSLKQYPGSDLAQTIRGMMSNLEVEMVLILGMMKMLMKLLPQYKTKVYRTSTRKNQLPKVDAR
jgi:hypothetical protein